MFIYKYVKGWKYRFINTQFLYKWTNVGNITSLQPGMPPCAEFLGREGEGRQPRPRTSVPAPGCKEMLLPKFFIITYISTHVFIIHVSVTVTRHLRNACETVARGRTRGKVPSQCLFARPFVKPSAKPSAKPSVKPACQVCILKSIFSYITLLLLQVRFIWFLLVGG